MHTQPQIDTTSQVERQDPRKSILPWLGGMGHTFFVIEPDNSEHGKLYGGWRNRSENGSLAHALTDLKPGQQVWQKVMKRGKYGAVAVSYKEVTP